MHVILHLYTCENRIFIDMKMKWRKYLMKHREKYERKKWKINRILKIASLLRY